MLLGVTAVPSPADAVGGLRKGPWLMQLRGDAVTVMLERDAPGPVTVRAWALAPRDAAVDRELPDPAADEAASAARPDAPADVEARHADTVALHEVALRGLSPGVRYRYEVSGPGLDATGGTFATPPAGDAPFRFVIYGDTRSNAHVHAAVVRAIAADGADFVVHTGDLIADGRSEALWQEFFDIERPLLASAPFVPVIGNHEIIRPGAGGVDNYRRYVHLDPAGAEPEAELDYVFGYGAVRIVVANAYSDWSAPEVRDWLAGAIDRARREVEPDDGFVLLVMHWGPRSSGPHGENRLVRAAGIDALLRRHAVDLVVSGHDHAYERGEDDGLRYLVSGGGGAPLYAQSTAREYAQMFAPEHHYVRADVTHGQIVFTAVRLDGSTLDRCTLRRRGWDCPPGRPVFPAPPSPDGVTRASLGGGLVGRATRWCPGRDPVGRTRGALALLALLGVALWAMARRPGGRGRGGPRARRPSSKRRDG